MSNFKQWTKHPDTHHWHNAEWLDNYFGNHDYAVRFNDGIVFDPRKTQLETVDSITEIGPDEIIDQTGKDEEW